MSFAHLAHNLCPSSQIVDETTERYAMPPESCEAVRRVLAAGIAMLQRELPGAPPPA